MRKKKFLTIFLFPNIWESSSWEAMEVEKYKEIGEVVSYEFGNLINKKLTKSFKKKFKNNSIRSIQKYVSWKEDFLKLIEKNKNKKIIIISKINSINLASFLILKEISKFNFPVFFFKNSGMPLYKIKKTFFEKICYFIDLRYVLNSFEKKIFNFLSKFIKYENLFYLVSGRKNLNNSKGKKVIVGNSWDLTKTYTKQNKIKTKKFIVFVESSLALGGDNNIGLNSPKLRKKIWFQNLNKFFSFIETKYKLDVVIALHPKNDPKKIKKNFYYGRKVYSNCTMELIKKAKFVFLERSTSINFVVKYGKPAFLIFNKDSISTSYNKQILETLSKILDLRKIDLDNERDWSKNLQISINKNKYKNFYSDYMGDKKIKQSNFKLIKESIKIL